MTLSADISMTVKTVLSGLFGGLTYGGSKADWNATAVGISFGLTLFFALFCLLEAIGWIAIEIKNRK